MILHKIAIHSFGCFHGQTLEFHDGLNVILGPNEAGKSTLFYAIQKTLLLPAKLKKYDFEKELSRFLPVGGGDMLGAEVEFSIAKDRYLLRRSWGSRPASILVLPGGASLNDENALRDRLDALLPARAGTFRSVLMTYQSGLQKTIEELKTDSSGTIQTLGDILRRAVLETDGVSLDHFKARLEALYDRYFSHWDRKLNYPEKGKGIDDPWKKEIGEILSAFYEKERIGRSLGHARDYEEKLDRVNKLIEESSGEVALKEEYLRTHKASVEAARERRTEEAELNAVRSQIELMRKANSEWPVSESKVEELKKNLPSLDQRRKPLEDEKKEIQIEESRRGLREKFQRVQLKKESVREALKRLQSVRKLERSNLEEIRRAFSVLQEMRAGLEGGKLSVELMARQECDLNFQRDFDGEYTQKVAKGERLRLEAGGRLKIIHPGLEMEVASGKIDFKEREQRYQEAEERLKTQFERHGIDTLEKAIEANLIYDKHLVDLKQSDENLSSELGTESFEELASKIEGMGHERAMRPLSAVIEELTKLQCEIENANKELAGHQHTVGLYQAKYGNKYDLLLAYAEAVRKEKNISDGMAHLAPMPEGVDSPEIFIRQYEQAQAELKDLWEKKNALLLQKAELVEREAPEDSAEELAVAFSDASDRFDATIKRGKAIEGIKTLTQKLLEKMDAGTFANLTQGLGETVSQLTDHRYSKVAMDGCLPEGFLRRDGKCLSYDLLSQGTKSILSLALRLVMADYFLKDAAGFLMMDDPLVDLDPARQKRAAETLSSFAERKQLLIFTCHPSSAELLGGHLIQL